ncbi:hypothetical protein AXF42_Ash015128 [Apostasia shenzhenica]|uniref:Glycoside hydrolase family 5 domain-containing protein n=1 Tax=Apostasia shenzhenica TaxID=1088818 RepID=A0A2I0AQC9_9ASPA|nr:hypothetical protein AXF42_Ash015128 [Apostasia shenzhenica]
MSFLISQLQPAAVVAALPLSTSSRWIVDESGRRVKLACVNWASHLETVVAEGLGKQPLDSIANKISSMGFNCVRLTWPLFLATDDVDATAFSAITVRQSFQALGLNESVAAMQVNNPTLVDLPLLQVYKAVVASLGDNKIMVVLDNHISKPGWCCSNFDGNGFFGDRYLDPDLWVRGLTRMATLFNGTPNVVAMSLRNELRGPKQNVNDWHKYMERGAEAVHAANPEVLVIFSGLSFDSDLSFLSNKQMIQLSFSSKAVFELHWYAFSNGKQWETGNPNRVCGAVAASFIRRGGFLVEQGWPLFILNLNDNRFLPCMVALAAELDVDWAVWALQGSYYVRQGVVGMNEYYGLLTYDWCQPRNSTFLQRISALQSPFQGPALSEISPYKVIFHPATGQCVLMRSIFEPLHLGPCNETRAWDYTEQQTLTLKGTLIMCLKAAGNGEKVGFGIICSDYASKWEFISDSKMHISSKLTYRQQQWLPVLGCWFRWKQHNNKPLQMHWKR